MGSARLDLDEQIEAGAETERSSNWFVGLQILEFSPEDWTGFWNPSEAGNEGISSEVVSLSLFSNRRQKERSGQDTEKKQFSL